MGYTEAFYWHLECLHECHINMGFKRQLLARGPLRKKYFLHFFLFGCPVSHFTETWKQSNFPMTDNEEDDLL